MILVQSLTREYKQRIGIKNQNNFYCDWGDQCEFKVGQSVYLQFCSRNSSNDELSQKATNTGFPLSLRHLISREQPKGHQTTDPNTFFSQVSFHTSFYDEKGINLLRMTLNDENNPWELSLTLGKTQIKQISEKSTRALPYSRERRSL